MTERSETKQPELKSGASSGSARGEPTMAISDVPHDWIPFAIQYLELHLEISLDALGDACNDNVPSFEVTKEAIQINQIRGLISDLWSLQKEVADASECASGE